MNTNNKLRELSKKELEQVSGGWGVTWGKVKGGGFYVQGLVMPLIG